MSEHVVGDTLTAAWLAAVDCLSRHNRELFNLVVDVVDPDPQLLDSRVVAELDQLLHLNNHQPVATVANTIFPSALAYSSTDRRDFYGRYQKVLPRLRKLRGNHKGNYFERLIDYPLRLDGRPCNQVENIVQDLIREQQNGRGLRFIYEAQVYAPGQDRQPMGFPCLSSLSFQMDRSQLRLSATYRNQYYFERALGNFLGLAQLQQFIAREAGLRQGPLTVIAFHAKLDGNQGDVARLLHNCAH